MKHRLNIRIDESLVKKAQAKGLNLTKTLERLLSEELKEPPAGFEPATFSLQGLNWTKFRDYLHSFGFAARYETTLFTNGMKYADCLFKRDFSKLREVPETNRPNVLKGLSALAKFNGMSKEFSELRAQYGFKWTGKSADSIFLERFQREETAEQLFSWIREVKQKRPGLRLFMDLMVSTGLRLIEGTNCWNILTSKGPEHYYNEHRSGLEHFQFKEVFLRRNKKAFFSYAHKSLVEEISGHAPLSRKAFSNPDLIDKLIVRVGLKPRFSDVRELHASFMLKWLKAEEIDFLHGRMGGSVFMRNYMNPSFMTDLKERAFMGIDAIQEKVQT